MTDRELLQQYAVARDEGAFLELVRRHGGMVHRTAARLVGDEAEDVAQAVFFLLARKAPRLTRQQNLAGWLYKATRYCCINARRIRSRRIERLEAAKEVAVAHPLNQEMESGLRDLLDLALSRLREDHRQVVLLRYLEGLSLEETAAQLGITSAAVAKRSERSLEKLRRFFADHSQVVSPAIVVAALQSQITQLPESLLAKLARSASGPASASAAQIAAATRTALILTRLKVAAAILLAASGLAATTWAVRTASTAAALSPATSPAATMPAVTREQAEAAATQFLSALRDRDEQRLAALLAGDSAAQRRTTAARYIADFRDGPYARFPDRLTWMTSAEFSSDRTGRLASVSIDIQTPTLVDIQHLFFRLRPTDGQWLVHEAVLTGADPTYPEWRITASQSSQSPAIPPGTYAIAADAFVQFRHSLDDLGGISDADKARALQSFKQAQADLARLAQVLKPTDLALSEESVQRFSQFLQTISNTLEQRGSQAMLVEANRMLEASPSLQEDNRRIDRLESVLLARADAEEDASRKTPRPPAFAPGVELTLGWNSQKYQLQGPVKVPDWLRAGRAFRLWQKRHNLQTLRTRDDEGNYYEVWCLPGIEDVIGTVRQYRADGTLTAIASYDDRGHVTSWGMLDKTGKRYLWKAATDFGTHAYLAELSSFDQDGNQLFWQIKPSGVVWHDQLNDPIGRSIRLEHIVDDRPNASPSPTSSPLGAHEPD